MPTLAFRAHRSFKAGKGDRTFLFSGFQRLLCLPIIPNLTSLRFSFALVAFQQKPLTVIAAAAAEPPNSAWFASLSLSARWVSTSLTEVSPPCQYLFHQHFVLTPHGWFDGGRRGLTHPPSREVGGQILPRYVVFGSTLR